MLDEVAFQTSETEREYLKVEIREGEAFGYRSEDEDVVITRTESLDLSQWDIYGQVIWKTNSYAVSSDAKTSIYAYKSTIMVGEKDIRLLYTYVDKDGNRRYKEAHDFSGAKDKYSLFYFYDYELNGLEFVIVGTR